MVELARWFLGVRKPLYFYSGTLLLRISYLTEGTRTIKKELNGGKLSPTASLDDLFKRTKSDELATSIG